MLINILETKEVSLSYGKKTILESVSLVIQKGEAVAVMGKNGCGKSTLLKALSGVNPIDKGSIKLNGVSVYETAAKKNIGYIPQDDIVFDDLTVLDNLVFWASANGLKKKAVFENEMLLALLGISEFMKKKVRHISGGMRKRLCIASSILHNPEILVLDEPLTGVDIVAKRELISYFKNLKQEGKTLIITSHDMDELSQLCDKFYFIDKGEIKLLSSADDFERLCKGVN